MICPEPEGIMTQSRPVDLVHLARYTGGDRSINAEVLTLFATQSVELLAKLEAALRESDSKLWRDITHSLKGGARGIGAFPMADSAAAAEAANPAQDQSLAERALRDLKSSSHTVALFINAYLGR